ncbi:MAG: flippase [Phormidesmis sp.]
MKSLVALLKIIALRSFLVSLSLAANIWLASLLGQSDYGQYVYIITLVSFLVIPTNLGLDRFLVREVSIYSSQAKWDSLAGLLHWSNLSVLLASLVLLGLGNGLIWHTHWVEASLRWPLSVGLLYIPLAVLKNLKLATIKGLNHVALGFLPDSLIAPLLLIGAIGLTQVIGEASLWHANLALMTAIVLQLMVVTITLIVGYRMLQQLLPQPVHHSSLKYQARHWIQSALPMMIFGALQIVHGRIDLLMLGSLKSPDSVAIYSAVWQGLRYVSLILLSANSLLAPRIAQLHAAGKLAELERMLVQYARIVVGLSAITILGLLLGSEAYLNLFGADYSRGRVTLMLLCAGQLINAATGSVGILLNMTGHERAMVISVGASVLLNIGLNFSLIPTWGINGAAIATVISLTFINLIKTLWAYRCLGIQVTFLGQLR